MFCAEKNCENKEHKFEIWTNKGDLSLIRKVCYGTQDVAAVVGLYNFPFVKAYVTKWIEQNDVKEMCWGKPMSLIKH